MSVACILPLYPFASDASGLPMHQMREILRVKLASYICLLLCLAPEFALRQRKQHYLLAALSSLHLVRYLLNPRNIHTYPLTFHPCPKYQAHKFISKYWAFSFTLSAHCSSVHRISFFFCVNIAHLCMDELPLKGQAR